jgi:hypothetical protein
MQVCIAFAHLRIEHTKAFVRRVTTFTYQFAWMNDELRIFRETVRRFIQEKFPPLYDRWRQRHRPMPKSGKKFYSACPTNTTEGVP